MKLAEILINMSYYGNLDYNEKYEAQKRYNLANEKEIIRKNPEVMYIDEHTGLPVTHKEYNNKKEFLFSQQKEELEEDLRKEKLCLRMNQSMRGAIISMSGLTALNLNADPSLVFGSTVMMIIADHIRTSKKIKLTNYSEPEIPEADIKGKIGTSKMYSANDDYNSWHHKKFGRDAGRITSSSFSSISLDDYEY